MRKLIWFPIMGTVLIGCAEKLTISNSSQNYIQMEPEELESLASIQVAQTANQIDEKTAFNLVWQLPLVQRKAREIQRLSKGTIRVAAIVYAYPVANDPYYKVRVFEGEPKHDNTIYWFRVLNTGEVIEVLDVIDNKYITLEEWRVQLKP
ncbi:hypothetical protein [Umezakia ovalisporum]|uniref:Lipoprotein n=2 Tax=Umezakia ovalisporum TaxID=75695 RepID=A0AA43KG66_9CYAN|nr:hypothetical protein [Umezakia ovalisporum]MDH6056716.1 hypothetical protein [Umezakia ovalisporum FSS-43]MDH6065684.1 hypothetical protein [Umezakia ovalisporum FSS-62]MDH6068672.1 hypothetical protein [Umezakia ovalisporum APH033B]MDH6070102.1 hypothetical protein [Umezakia ovalisporum CobakiLakeA]MDH6072953.1 hypothetical protein [Umezakia ovalisporum CS-1034]